MSGQVQASSGRFTAEYRATFRESGLGRVEDAARGLTLAVDNLREAGVTGYDARLLALSAEIYDLAIAMQRRLR